MSIYGPKIRIPKPSMPNISIPKVKINFKVVGIILILILAIATITFISSIILSFDNHIGIAWTNNPLYLKDNSTSNAELKLTIVNNTDSLQTISLNVSTESKELIIFCPDSSFPNVAPENKRETTCIIRRNPSEKIFSGTYQLLITTNLGSAKTTLEIRK